MDHRGDFDGTCADHGDLRVHDEGEEEARSRSARRGRGAYCRGEGVCKARGNAHDVCFHATERATAAVQLRSVARQYSGHDFFDDAGAVARDPAGAGASARFARCGVRQTRPFLILAGGNRQTSRAACKTAGTFKSGLAESAERSRLRGRTR